MNALFLSFLFSAFAVILSVFVLLRCIFWFFGSGKNRSQGILPAVFGVLVSFLGIGLAIWSFWGGLHPSKRVPIRGTLLSAPAEINGGVSWVELSPHPHLGPVRPTISLANAGLDLTALTAVAKRNQAFILFDASNGIRPEYRPWIEWHFGKLEEYTQPSALICYRRTTLFPLSSGRCVSREVKYTVPVSPLDVGRITESRAAVTLRRIEGAVLGLTLASFPRATSIEEGCLESLADHSTCAALETMPSDTLGSVFVQSLDPNQLKIFREFDIPTPQEQDVGLSIYDDSTRLEIIVDDKFSEKNHVCGGMTAPNQIRILKLARVSEELATAKTEKEATTALDRIDEIRDCAAIGVIQVPTLQIGNRVSALRSILTQLRERPLWITTPESIKVRLDKIDQTQFTWSATDGSLWIKPASKIRNLALTIISTHPVSDKDLAEAAITDDAVSLNIHRLTPSAFRYSFSELRSEIGLRVSEKIWKGRPLSGESFLDWTGFAGSALLAFLLATIVSLFQSATLVRGRALPFYFGTFFGVFVIIFIWTFLSYRAALAPTGISISEAAVERPPAPIHFFLRDWPDTGSIASLKLDQSGDAWKKWGDYLAAARAELKSVLAKKPGKMLVAGVSRITRTTLPGGGRIVLWDDARARNFHYRRNPEYRAASVGWESLLRRRHAAYALENGSNVDQALRRSPQVLVIIDARFMDDSENEKLKNWVQSGGTVVVSDGGVPNAVQSAPGSAWLQGSGFGSSSSRSYSRVQPAGSRSFDLVTPHEVVPSASNSGIGEAPYGAMQLGTGRVFFLGVTPIDPSSQDFVGQWIGGVTGERIGVPETGRACTTTLLLEPWGASVEHLRSFAYTLRSRGIPFQWLVDPVSFAEMMPQWGDEFRRDGVVFRDDGKRATRELAALLAARAGWTDTSSLIFGFGGSSNLSAFGKTEQGPNDAVLLHYVSFPGDMATDWAIHQWKAECAFGATDARLLDSAWVERGGTIMDVISTTALRREDFTPGTEVTRVFRESVGNTTSPRGRILMPEALDPLSYSFEVH